MSPLLVGREKECAELRTHLAASGGLIPLSGEAGAGKTALVEQELGVQRCPTASARRCCCASRGYPARKWS
jgi:hypothetical protein